MSNTIKSVFSLMKLFQICCKKLSVKIDWRQWVKIKTKFLAWIHLPMIHCCWPSTWSWFYNSPQTSRLSSRERAKRNAWIVQTKLVSFVVHSRTEMRLLMVANLIPHESSQRKSDEVQSGLEGISGKWHFLKFISHSISLQKDTYPSIQFPIRHENNTSNPIHAVLDIIENT